MLAIGFVRVVIWQPCGTDVIHVANVLYLCSYLVRDILWLRVLSVAAGLCLMPYYCSCGTHPLWAPIIWNALFTFVNIVQIGILILERWPRKLRGPELSLHDSVFPGLTASEFLRLVKNGAWQDVAPGELVVAQGSVVKEMMVLTEGRMDVRVGDRQIAQLRPGQFVGEMSFLSGNSAAADVVAAAPSRVLSWSQTSLAKLLDTHVGLSFKIRAILGRDMVGKLRAHDEQAE